MQVRVRMEEAQDAVLSLVVPLNGETVDLAQASGRVLHEDQVAGQSLPPYPQSAVDGYAVHGDDIGRERDGIEHLELTLRQHLKAGEVAGYPLAPGETVRVVTGGPAPDFTAAVVAEERVRLPGGPMPDGNAPDGHDPGARVLINDAIAPGSNLRMTGEDFRSGEVIARTGTRLTPGLIGVLAAMGQGAVRVYSRPRVAIVSFGRELVPAHETPAPGQTRDCNGPLLAALVARDGGVITGVEILADDDRRSDISRLEKLAAQSDVLLTIGGTSNETGDQALIILRELGARALFWGIRIKPGSHSGACSYRDRPTISLSGNPAACSVGYELLAAPVLRALQGAQPPLRRLTAVCTSSFSRAGGPHRFLRGYAICGQEGWRVAVLPGQKSSMMRSLIDCNSLIELPAGHPPVEAGSEVSLILTGNA